MHQNCPVLFEHSCKLNQNKISLLKATDNFPKGQRPSHHAGRHPSRLHQATAPCCGSTAHFQHYDLQTGRPDHYHATQLGGAAHAGARHPDHFHFLRGLLTAGAGPFICLLLPLLHQFIQQRLTQSQHMSPGSRGRHLQVQLHWAAVGGKHGLMKPVKQEGWRNTFRLRFWKSHRELQVWIQPDVTCRANTNAIATRAFSRATTAPQDWAMG